MKNIERDYVRDNVASAKIILEDEARYGGEDGAMLQWARRIMARHAPKKECREPGGNQINAGQQLSMFASQEAA